jgi:hypothetical protein
MPVPLQDEPRVGMPELFRNHLCRDAGCDHQWRIRVPQVVEREPVKPAARAGRKAAPRVRSSLTTSVT